MGILRIQHGQGPAQPWRALAQLLALTVACALGCESPDDGYDDDDDSATASAEMSALEVQSHAHNVLSCTVRWTTSVPATSRVEFGEGNELRFFVEDSELVTDHELLVLGMRPLRSHRLEAVSVTVDGTTLRSAPTNYRTAALPFDAAITEVTVYDSALSSTDGPR